LLWLALNPQLPVSQLPAGWTLGRLPDSVAMDCGDAAGEVLDSLKQFFWEDSAVFLGWLGSRLGQRTNPFERAMISADWDPLQNFSTKQQQGTPTTNQLALL
jgi:hypothetical protein